MIALIDDKEPFVPGVYWGLVDKLTRAPMNQEAQYLGHASGYWRLYRKRELAEKMSSYSPNFTDIAQAVLTERRLAHDQSR